MIRVAVLGATGRMGRTLCRLVADSRDLRVTGAVTEPGHASIGQDIGEFVGLNTLGVMVTDDATAALANSQVAIDFTLAAAASMHIAACRNAGVALVMGTTGLSADQQAQLDEASRDIPIVYGRNMSVGINVVTELVRLATRALGDDYDVEITEAHHRNKIDAPSGTALQLGEAVAEERGGDLRMLGVYDRHDNNEPRKAGAIGFTSVRAGTIVGDHAVLLVADEEIVEVRHRALDRAVFGRGALRAARWLIEQPAGLYSMNHVLGLAGR